MIENLKLEKNLGKLIIVLDDLLRLWAIQELVLLLEDLHRVLDMAEQLPSPGYFTWRGKININGPCQANLVLIAYASSDDSGEPAHPRSLARTFATRSYKQ